MTLITAMETPMNASVAMAATAVMMITATTADVQGDQGAGHGVIRKTLAGGLQIIARVDQVLRGKRPGKGRKQRKGVTMMAEEGQRTSKDRKRRKGVTMMSEGGQR